MSEKVTERQRLQEILLDVSSMVDETAYCFVNDLKENSCLWSDNAVDYLGLPAKRFSDIKAGFFSRIHPDDLQIMLKKLADTSVGADTSHDLQYRIRNKDNSYVLVTGHGALVRDNEGKPSYYAGAIIPTQDKNSFDPISGLQTLNGFFTRLHDMIEGRHPFVVLEVGINDFSEINDLFGYTYGNRVIREFAKAFRKKYEDSGIVYRLDGAKFALITTNRTISDINRSYEELRQYCNSEFLVDEKQQNISLNAGAVEVKEFNLSDQTIYTCMTYAYKNSKEHRQGDLSIFEGELGGINTRNIALINDIRNSILNDCEGFFMCYQPVINILDNTINGAESLIRWRDKDGRIVPPNDFIPILENDVLFPELGKWILSQSLLEIKPILDTYPDFSLKVNLSYSQIVKGDFIQAVIEILEETKFPAENLCLEITERCRLLDTDMLLNVTTALKGINVSFALDDFGTGFASLGALKVLQADLIKIDRRFIMSIASDKKDYETVKLVSDIAKVYDASLCAEGVETKELLDLLRQQNIETVQGFYFSKPIPIDEFMKWCEDYQKTI